VSSSTSSVEPHEGARHWFDAVCVPGANPRSCLM
jgi:hypothetical protein